MTSLPTGQITVHSEDVRIKVAVNFTFKKILVEYVDGVSVSYKNDAVHNGVISEVTEDHIASGRKIEAIKKLREDNEGLGLKEAKDIAEAMIALQPPRKHENSWDEIDRAEDELGEHFYRTHGFDVSYPPRDLLQSFKYVEYIKQLRAKNNLDLKPAKDFADLMFSRLGLLSNTNR
jgi:ribosomal protein L7/L12